MQRPRALEKRKVSAKDHQAKRSRGLWVAIAACVVISTALLIATFAGLFL